MASAGGTPGDHRDTQNGSPGLHIWSNLIVIFPEQETALFINIGAGHRFLRTET